MSFRRRTSFPGIQPAALKELIGLQDDVARDIQVLRGEAIGNTTDTKVANYAAKFNERIRSLPPTAGCALTIPGGSSKNQNKWIEVLKLGGGTLTVVPTSGTVQGAATLAITTAGFYYLQSDGTSGWWLQPTGGGGGLTPPVALTDLASQADQTWNGNISGAPAPQTANTLAQLRTYIGAFTAALAGLVPASGGGVVNFLRADGAWAPPGGGGALTLLTTEVNLGSKPTFSGSFTIAGAGMTIGKPVLIQQAVGPYTGKGTLADEAEDQVSVSASVTSAVLITAYWQAVASPIVGNVRFNYAVSA